MNVGLYSFKTLELSKVENLKNQIYSVIGRKCEIYIYSENNRQERLSKRGGLRKILEDYEASKIECIIFEDRMALGTDEYTTYRILKILLDKNVNFTSLNDRFNSSSLGRSQIKLIGFFENYAKEYSDKRSKTIQKIKKCITK